MITIKSSKGDISELLGSGAKCPNCGSTLLVYTPERGEVTCASCGSVIDIRVIDRGAEWRAITQEEKDKKSRVGPPHKHFVSAPSSISSQIDRSGKDATGRKLTSAERALMGRLKKWHSMSTASSIDRNLMQAESEIDRLVAALGLSTAIKDDAMLVYRKALEADLVKGRAIESMAAASLYAACRINRIPITLDEITANLSGGVSKRRDVARCYRLILREVGIKVSLADPKDYVDRIVNTLGLNARIQTKALEILEKASEAGLTAGKDPAGVAATAVYIASLLEGVKITQKDVAKVASVTEVTVRNRYKEFVSRLKLAEITISA